MLAAVLSAEVGTIWLSKRSPTINHLLWSPGEDRELKPPERLEQIVAGELDEHPVAVADAIQARRELLHTVRSAHARAKLCVRDTGVFTARIRPRYLQHELAVIQALDDH